jgi:hypothetical protein
MSDNFIPRKPSSWFVVGPENNAILRRLSGIFRILSFLVELEEGVIIHFPAVWKGLEQTNWRDRNPGKMVFIAIHGFVIAEADARKWAYREWPAMLQDVFRGTNLRSSNKCLQVQTNSLAVKLAWHIMRLHHDLKVMSQCFTGEVRDHGIQSCSWNAFAIKGNVQLTG